MRSQICAEIIVQAFRGFITFLILVHHRFSDAYNKIKRFSTVERLKTKWPYVAVGSERGYWTLDLHPKASRNADLRGCPNGTERIPVSRLLRLIWVWESDGASHQRRHVAVTLLSEKTDAAMMPPMTTKRATGLFFRKFSRAATQTMETFVSTKARFRS